ncbi:MAG: HK97 family phage prohead protease [Armatimonadota bacterium]
MKSTLKLQKLLPMLSAETQETVKELVDVETAEVKRKSFASATMEIADGEQASVGYITTNDIDRDSEILVPQGGMLDQYRENPVVLWSHDYSQPAIGKATALEVTSDGIRAKTAYADTDRAQEIWSLVKGGFIRTASVGILPVEYVDKGTKNWPTAVQKYSQDWSVDKSYFDQADRIYTKWLLLEYSIVNIPANPGALIEAVGKGFSVSDEIIHQLGIELPEAQPEPGVILKALQTIDTTTDLKAIDLLNLNVSLRPISVDTDRLAYEAMQRRLGRV